MLRSNTPLCAAPLARLYLHVFFQWQSTYFFLMHFFGALLFWSAAWAAAVFSKARKLLPCGVGSWMFGGLD
eukprot:1726590-Rhodomonas_salina.1